MLDVRRHNLWGAHDMVRLVALLLIALVTCQSHPAIAQTAKSSLQKQPVAGSGDSDEHILREAAELARSSQRGTESKAAALKGYERLLSQHPGSNAAPLLRALRDGLREKRAETELRIAMFYLLERGNRRASESRLTFILENYSTFSRLDEVLFQLSVIQVETGRSTDAIASLEKLVARFTRSPRTREARARLAALKSLPWVSRHR